MNVSESDIAARLDGTRLREGAYAQDLSLTEIRIPEGVTDIGEVAFFGCSNLREIQFPESLRYIREEAFGETGLLRVTVPARTELIAEKAFFSCDSLARIDVLSPDCTLERDAFGSCRSLLEGFVAKGYPDKYRQPEELLYTLLWCTCPERHRSETNEHARRFIWENEALIMEKVLKFNNVAAMNGISKLHLLRPENINSYVAAANLNHQCEIVALLLAEVETRDPFEEFTL